MRWVWLMVLVLSCAPAVAAPPPTEDPRIAEAQRANAALAEQVRTLQATGGTPTFVMWNTPLTMPSGYSTDLGLPDTFTVRIRFTATTPVRVRVMTFDDYVRFKTGRSVDVLTYPATTSLDVTFHDAEGCAGYIAVFDAAAESVITPNVTITRVSPEQSRPTGHCAH